MSDAATIIREARTSAGLTQAELASRMGTTQSVVARLESPGANPRVQTLARAIRAAGRQLELSVDKRSRIDETLIAASLRQTPAQRLREFASFYRFAQKAGSKAFQPSGP